MAVDKPAGADTAHAPAQPGWAVLCGCWACPVWWPWSGLLPTLKVNESPVAPAAGGRALAQWLADGGASGAGCGAGGVAGARVGLRAPAVSSWLAGQPAGLRCGPNSCPDSGAVSRVLHGCGCCPGWRLRRSSLRPRQCHATGGAAVWRHHRRAADALGCDDPAAVAGLAPAAARAGQPGMGWWFTAVLFSAVLFLLGHLPAAQAMAGVLTMPVR